MNVIIITGANGFLGSALLKVLAAGGGENIIAVSRSNRGITDFSGVKRVAGDLRDVGFWKSLSDYRPAVVLHLAASIPASFFGDAAKSAAEINEIIDDNAIDFCEKAGGRLIYASSTAVYDPAVRGIVRESDVCRPGDPYGREKCNAEKKIGDSSKLKNHCILRINAPYGPGQRMKTVVRIFLENALKNQPLLFHGSGSRTQDFTYVSDVAGAFLAALRTDVQGTFNIAGGASISMENLAFLVRSLVPGCASEIRASGEKDAQEDFRANYDISLAKEKIGWQPKVGLMEGFLKYIEFLKTNQCE